MIVKKTYDKCECVYITELLDEEWKQPVSIEASEKNVDSGILYTISHSFSEQRKFGLFKLIRNDDMKSRKKSARRCSNVLQLFWWILQEPWQSITS